MQILASSLAVFLLLRAIILPEPNLIKIKAEPNHNLQWFDGPIQVCLN